MFPGYNTVCKPPQKRSVFYFMWKCRKLEMMFLTRKFHWKCVNISQLLISESKKRYMSLTFFVGRFASVSNTFMGFWMNSFLVGVEWNLERCNYLYIIGSKFISAETWKLFIWHNINVLLTDAKLPSMHLCKKMSRTYTASLTHLSTIG